MSKQRAFSRLLALLVLSTLFAPEPAQAQRAGSGGELPRLQKNYAEIERALRSVDSKEERRHLLEEHEAVRRAIAEYEKIHFIDLDFEGGTLAEYLKLVRGLKSGIENIVVDRPELAERAKLPALTLEKVDLEGALELIERLTVIPFAVRVASLKSQSGGEPVYVLNVLQKRSRQAEVSVRILALGEVVEGEKIEALLSAIEVGLALARDGRAEEGDPGPEPELKLHEATGLLFMRGVEEDQHLVEAIVQSATAKAQPPGLAGAGGRGVRASSRRGGGGAQPAPGYAEELQVAKARAAELESRIAELEAIIETLQSATKARN